MSVMLVRAGVRMGVLDPAVTVTLTAKQLVRRRLCHAASLACALCATL